jgi:GWxTD domain-containing protein
MKRPTVLLFATVLLLAPSTGAAQGDTARRHVEAGLNLAAAGDTAAALAELRLAVKAAPDLADAHYQLGRLLGRHASGDEFDFHERLEAQHELLLAYELDPGNAEIMAEFGRLRIKQRMPVDGGRVAGRAKEMAEASGEGNAALADVEYALGLGAELQYERFRDRRIVPAHISPISTTVPPNREAFALQLVGGAHVFASTPITVSRYVEWYLDNAPPLERSGYETRERIIRHYRNALRYDPTHIEAARRLMIFLLEDGELGEYMTIAERLVEAHPDRPEADLYLGLGLQRLGRENEAQVAFEHALERMRPADRAPFYDLAPLMRRRPASSYQQLDDSVRAGFEERYWRFADPLLLTEANELRLEHWARVAYADLRYYEPSEGLRGWQTDRGVTYIRYGPPAVVARMGTQMEGNAQSIIVWYYGDERPIFMFRQNPGYLYAPFAGDYEFVANEARHHQPAAYANIPSIPEYYPLPLQVARFRGESAREIAVEVHGELPLDSLAWGLDIRSGEIETGLFLLNQDGVSIVQQVNSEVLEYADASSRNALRSWRLILPAAGHLVATVEVRDPNSWRAAAARDTFTASYFPDDSLSLSDILLAEAIRPLSATPVRRTDFDIAANPSRRYAPNQPVVIYYELYGLEHDREGFGSYEVSLAVTLTSLNREGSPIGGDRNPLQIIGALADAWGFSPVGDNRLELRFARELDLKGRDRATEYHSLDLRRAPAGEYEITLKVWDRLGQRLASQVRTFTVTRD